jgi:adenylate cyclase
VQPPNEQRVERRLAAIFAADVAGYSRLISQDEAGTLRALAAARDIMDRLIVEHSGRIANTAGDSVLAEFPSAVDAVQCAVAVQEKLAEVSAGVAEDRRLQFRIGIHLGDVVVRGSDLLGDGVNITARLEAVAEPGGICISAAAHAHVRKGLPLAYTDLGEQHVALIHIEMADALRVLVASCGWMGAVEKARSAIRRLQAADSVLRLSTRL